MDLHHSKVRVGNETGQADRLSELPEALLVLILSKLEMKDAVKTGILSKRWGNLWTQVDRIVYKFTVVEDESEEEYHRKLEPFISFVDHSLMKCTCSKIRKFSLGGCFYWGFKNDDKSVSRLLDKWLSFLMDKKVENLKLSLGHINYTAPDCLYRNSSLEKLDIDYVCLNASSTVSWKLLKKLELFGTWLDDRSIANILRGSPVLEAIEMCCVGGINHLNIESKSVKRLVLRHFEHEDVRVNDYLDIKAPWLEELEISDSFLVPQCKLVNIASLKKATLAFAYSCDPAVNDDIVYDMSTGIPFDIWWNEMVFGLSKSVCQVEDITLGTEVIQALAVAKLRGASYPVFKCKHLMITSPIWKNDIYPIACLLQNMPCLESLSIKVENWKRYYTMEHTMPFASDDFQSRELHKNLPAGKLKHLKSVKIEYIVEGVQKPLEIFDFELVSYILRNAPVLEKIVLLTSGGKDCSDSCPSYCACQNAPSLSSKLLSTWMVWNKTLALKLRKTGSSVFEFGVSHHAQLSILLGLKMLAQSV